AEAARLEQEEVGTPDSEALFASNVKAKRPKILAARAGYI
ncbi:NADH dehydrogenase, partial [Bacillus mycoides]|nr:NADH dehydrogenase [Bacillus mycoides]